MLLKREVLERIVSRQIDLVFRRWKRPTVKAGGALRTSVGMLAIDSVDKVSLRSISAADARRAGFATRRELTEALAGTREGDLYRIGVSFAGADPRIELRESADLTEQDVAELRTRLDRFDATSTHGPWTDRTLRILSDRPHVRAEDLASEFGLDKPTFKNDVRKLKSLGLTISHSPGYELSPRGKALLDRL